MKEEEIRIKNKDRQIVELDNELEKWNPIIGVESNRLFNSFLKSGEIEGIDALEKLKDETTDLLSKCGDPSKETHEGTGLAFGKIQSGKTMSYISLISMARDNGYPLIILIAGTTNALLTQTTDRVKESLNTERYGDVWRLIKEPTKKDLSTIEGILKNNQEEDLEENEKVSIIITLKKNKATLNNSILLIKNLNLNKIPTLIIDDESDQASVNTQNRANIGKEEDKRKYSVIYSKMKELKENIPHHTFVQYTATPQANLTTSIFFDILSPKFIHLLNPGEGYVGGKEFFKENSYLTEIIPDIEIESKDNELHQITKSLEKALKIFFIEAMISNSIDNEELPKKNISMLVHPSVKMDSHKKHANWIKNIKTRWAKTLEKEEGDKDRDDLIKEFKDIHIELKKTVPHLKNLTEKDFKKLKRTITKTEVIVKNSRNKKEIEWKKNRSFIIVGGYTLDRGMTLPGLVITYMPRGIGGGNSDSIQQRARFYGYKKDYLLYCRTFLERKLKDGYEEYIETEYELRKALMKYSNMNLDSWKREFFVEMLKITRGGVIAGEISSINSKTWERIKHFNNWGNENNSIVEKFIDSLDKSKLTSEYINKYIVIKLKNILNLFERISFDKNDENVFLGIIDILKEKLKENENLDCRIYLMNHDGKNRNRAIDKSGEIHSLFGGNDPRGEGFYPGDINIGDRNIFNLQIYKIQTTGEYNKKVYALAFSFPKSDKTFLQLNFKNDK